MVRNPLRLLIFLFEIKDSKNIISFNINPLYKNIILKTSIEGFEPSASTLGG